MHDDSHHSPHIKQMLGTRTRKLGCQRYDDDFMPRPSFSSHSSCLLYIGPQFYLITLTPLTGSHLQSPPRKGSPTHQFDPVLPGCNQKELLSTPHHTPKGRCWLELQHVSSRRKDLVVQKPARNKHLSMLIAWKVSFCYWKPSTCLENFS